MKEFWTGLFQIAGVRPFWHNVLHVIKQHFRETGLVEPATWCTGLLYPWKTICVKKYDTSCHLQSEIIQSRISSPQPTIFVCLTCGFNGIDHEFLPLYYMRIILQTYFIRFYMDCWGNICEIVTYVCNMWNILSTTSVKYVKYFEYLKRVLISIAFITMDIILKGQCCLEMTKIYWVGSNQFFRWKREDRVPFDHQKKALTGIMGPACRKVK